MSDDSKQEPKIFVDSDWKQQAAREKEEADRQTRQTAEEQALEPSFAEIVQVFMIQASVGLGGFQDPRTGQHIPPNLPLARHYIELLGLLEQKTAGNLDEQEKQFLGSVLHELRMAFVQVAGVGAGLQEPEPQA